MSVKKQYVVLMPFIGYFKRGDLVTADQLPAKPDVLIDEGAIREATAEEAKAGVWVEYPEAVKAPTTATKAEATPAVGPATKEQPEGGKG